MLQLFNDKFYNSLTKADSVEMGQKIKLKGKNKDSIFLLQQSSMSSQFIKIEIRHVDTWSNETYKIKPRKG